MIKKKNKISVIMTTYNGSKYILEQLKSINEQTLQPDEVLIFDDKSTDELCPHLINQFVIKNHLQKRWHLNRNENNLGWKKNFIQALKKATGDLIFLSDQDDIWNKEKISIMANVMNKNENINVLCCNYRLLNESGNKQRMNSTQNNIHNGILEKKELTPKFHLVGRPGCTYCVRKAFVQSVIDAWIDDYAHDKLLWNAAILTGSLYCINKPLITFRRHGNNASGRGTILTAEERLRRHQIDQKVYENICKTISNKDFYNTDVKQILIKYQKWMKSRELFLTNKSLLGILNLLQYHSFYSSWLSLFADIISK